MNNEERGALVDTIRRLDIPSTGLAAVAGGTHPSRISDFKAARSLPRDMEQKIADSIRAVARVWDSLAPARVELNPAVIWEMSDAIQAAETERLKSGLEQLENETGVILSSMARGGKAIMDSHKPLKTDGQLAEVAKTSLESADELLANLRELRAKYEANGDKPLGPLDVFGSVAAVDDLITVIERHKVETVVGLQYALGKFGWTMN